MTIIHDIDQFLAAIKPGDTFWVLASCCGDSNGFSKYQYIEPDEETNAKYKDDPLLQGPWIIVNTRYGTGVTAAVSDLCNGWHGVALSQGEAEAEHQLRCQGRGLGSDAWEQTRMQLPDYVLLE